MSYEYSALSGLIVEKCGSRKNFASKMGLSEATISKKLTNKVAFDQDDIEKAKAILEIETADIGRYFFTEKVQAN